MIQTFQRMRELFPVLNRRAVTDAMVRRACKRLDTLLFYQPLRLDGYFVPASVSASGQQEIYVNSRLTPAGQLVAAVHEVKHAALDVEADRVLASSHKGLATAKHGPEFDAYAISAIALIPESKLINASRGLFDVEDEFLTDLWRVRLKVHDLYGPQLR